MWAASEGTLPRAKEGSPTASPSSRRGTPPTGAKKILQRITPHLALNGRYLSGEAPLPVSNLMLTHVISTTSGPYPSVTSTQRTAPASPTRSSTPSSGRLTSTTTGGPGSPVAASGKTRAMVSMPSSAPTGRGTGTLGPVVGAPSKMPDDAYAIAEEVAKEFATEHCGFYSDRKQGAVAAFFLSQIYRSWGLVTYRGWACLMLDRRSPTRPDTAPSALTPKPTTKRIPPSIATSTPRPAAGSGLRVKLMPRRRPALLLPSPPPRGGVLWRKNEQVCLCGLWCF